MKASRRRYDETARFRRKTPFFRPTESIQIDTPQDGPQARRMLGLLSDTVVVVSVLCALTCAALVLWAALNGAGRARREAAEALEMVARVHREWASEKAALEGALALAVDEYAQATRTRNRASAIVGNEKKAAQRAELEEPKDTIENALAGGREAVQAYARRHGQLGDAA